MKTKISLLTVVLLGLWAIASGGEFSRVLTFSEEDLLFSKVNNYDLVKLRGYPLTGDPGKPLLPSIIYQVVLPATAVITGVEVVRSEMVDLPSQYLIHPAQIPRPISSEEKHSFVEPDEVIYNSISPYPEMIVEKTETGSMSGYRIGECTLHPLVYIPSERRLRLYIEIELRIIYREGAVSPIPKTQSQSRIFGETVKEIVSNPEDVKRWTPPLRSHLRASPLLPLDTIEYVVITTSAYDSIFQELVDWKTKKGVPGRVVKLSDISGYSGRDVQEKIRNFIIDADSTWGAIWFLLGGDPSNDVVPTRLTTDFGYGPYDDVASDWYFSDLDGDWDANGNNIFGEMGDSVDMYSDVFVGRASVGTYAEAQKFVDKVLTYELNPPTDYLEKELLAGDWLFPNYGGWVVGDSIAAVTPADYSITKLYQNLGNLNAQAVLDSIDAGYQFVHYGCHGNYDNISTGPDAIFSWMVDELTNSDVVGIHIGICCIVGRLDYEDCIVEHFMNNQNGGTVAWIGNSRYGFGTAPNMGPSELLDFEFFILLFNSSDFRIGNVHASAKGNYAPYAQPGMSNPKDWKYCIYEHNLFGDPEMPVWTDTPMNLTVDHPHTITPGPQDFTVVVTNGRDPIENALVCVRDSTVYAYGYTDPTGQITLSTDVITYPDTLEVTVTAQNFYPYEGECGVVEIGVEEATKFQFPIFDFQLSQNHPNPFCRTTAICYSVPGSGGAEVQGSTGALQQKEDVALQPCPSSRGTRDPREEFQDRGTTYKRINLSIYNVTGRLVRTLVDSEQEPGHYSVNWDGRNSSGKEVAAGIYFYRLSAGEFTTTKKMALIK